MAEEAPTAYLCVYPFVRSYEWYLLPEEERRAMLTEHGMLARPYPDVRANTVSAFALGDYEWILAFEADELHRIVDLMRALRAAAARRHTREEVPFYTGRRRELATSSPSGNGAACNCHRFPTRRGNLAPRLAVATRAQRRFPTQRGNPTPA